MAVLPETTYYLGQVFQQVKGAQCGELVVVTDVKDEGPIYTYVTRGPNGWTLQSGGGSIDADKLQIVEETVLSQGDLLTAYRRELETAQLPPVVIDTFVQKQAVLWKAVRR